MIKVWHLPIVVGALLLVGCGSSTSSTSSASASNPSATTPLATQPASPQDAAAQADVPVYPGAKFPDNVTKPASKDEAGKTHTYLVMTTPDSLEKVAAFYQTKGHYSAMKTGTGTEIQGMSPKGDLVLIDLTASGGLTTISVKSVQGS